MAADKKEEKEFDPEEDVDPKTLKAVDLQSNLFGQNKAFERLVNLDCNEIKKVAHENVFTLNTINDILGENINFNKAKKLGFVATDEAKIRVATILLAARSRIFLLITGSTSSAKTFSVLVASHIYENNVSDEGVEGREQIKLLRKNLSEDSTRDDLIGSIIYDDKKDRFIFKQGDFTEAFEKGYWLLLDELSLAPPSVLQAIEAALDSNRLTVQEIGSTREINMHKNFFLVCTTNPNNEEYSRFNLSQEFLDRFHCITFNNLSNNEMKNIILKKCQRIDIDHEIQQIVNAHIKYTGEQGPKCKNMYTLRELDKACLLLDKGYKAEKIIDILYRTRAGEDMKTYTSSDNPFRNHQNFISTSSRNKYGKLALDCLENGFNIILESENSEGTSYFAEAIANQFNSRTSPLIISMTNELHVSDLTHFSVPVVNDAGGNTEMKIQVLNGVIYKAMKEGRVVIINDLERGNTRVIESLNDIYESNVLEESTMNFQRDIEINPNFRIIFTFHSNVQHKLSAAFFNRFIHIKIIGTGEISRSFKTEKGMPINIYHSSVFPSSVNVKNEVENLCQKKNIAHTSQVEAVYSLTMASIKSKIPICILGVSGYGRTLGIDLMLKKENEESRIHYIYCTSETSIDTLIGKFVFEGRLLFQEGPLLQAATKGEIIIFKNIDKLSYHAFSCIESILCCLKNKGKELVIPGIDVSKYTLSQNFCCLATIDGDAKKEIPYHISKYFRICTFASPTKEDYEKICQLDNILFNDRRQLIDSLVSCFLSCYESKDIFDTSYRMLKRILSSIERLCPPVSPIYQAISLFALFQNINENNKVNLIANLGEKLKFNASEAEKLIESDVVIKDKQLVKGHLSCSIASFEDLDKIKALSKEQLNVAFYIISCHSPINIIGPTSFKETIIKTLKQNRVKVFNATSETTIGDIIGSISFKKNNPQSGKFGHGDIYDLLIDYMTTNFSTHSKIIALNLNLPESFANVEKIINDMDEGKLKPYFQYLLNIVKQESEYATFFELGYIIRELLLDNIVLLKNVDQCSQNIIDSLIPFLNDTIDLNQYIPGIVYHQTSSLFFTCSEQGFNKLPSNFKSRVQNVQIRYLGKDDIKSCVEDFHLLDAYDFHIHDYSDIMRAINIIKVAGVLNKFNTSEERIRVSQNIFEMKSEHFASYDLFNINDNNKIYELDELLQYDDASQMLHAKRTGVMIKVPNYNDIPLKTIVYIPSVAYLLDLAIISLATHIPLIVESSPGQTKSTLVRLLGEAFGKQTVVTNMSKNRTSEEFIGQLIPTDKGFSYEIGDLYKYMDKDIFYLIDEINLASPSLLSQFLSIFKAPYDSDVAHPREPGPFPKKFDLFATMNPATLTAGRTYLPPGFSSCSITYKMPNYSKWDNAVIFTNILCQFRDNLEDFEESSKFIVECHKDSLDQSNDVTIRDMLKLAEAFKSCLLKDPRISKNTIASLIQLIYSSKMINKDEFDEKVDKFRGVINKKTVSKKITKSQIRLIEQMKDALSMNRGIIIRGPSGCGKTHCIKCLANGDFDGHEHKLYTIQLCAESDISELFGRFEPYYLDNDKALRKLKQSILIQLGDESINDEISNKLTSYLAQLSDKESSHKIVESMKLDPIITELPMIEKKINKYLDKSKRSLQFVYRNSPLIDAMEHGDWIVLDNINLCPGDILESLNSLLEESHSLRISKGKHDTVYAMSLNENIENGKQIHQDFRLIMTSDDRVLDTSHILPAPFLSRCIVLKIGTPENQDLSNISRNYFDVPIYSDFLCKCFVNQPKNHVRDIIRMIKLCKFLNLNQKIFKREYELGKTIKFVLENNYSIPDSFIIPKSDNDDIIKETLSIIQTNLMNNTLTDQDFHPLNLDEMKRSLQQLNQSLILNDLKQLFKETLRLCCYIYSSKSFYPNTRNNEIQNKLITFLLCGYLVSCDPTKLIPETIWNLKFMPAIWDFLFITKDNYGDFSTKNGFIDFLNSHYMESDEFAIEFYNYANKNTRGYKNNKDQYLEIINNLFSRRYGPDHIEFFKNQEKSRIIIQYLPIQFPSIPNYKLIQNNITYDKLIEIFNWLNISHPYNNKIMLSFNFSIEQYAISSEFQFIYNNTYDLDVATIYSEILKYDDEYRLLKKISEMAENSNDLYGTICQMIKPYNMTIDSLSNCRKEINEKYNKHTELTDLIIDILNKAANIISRAYEQKRELEELNQNQQRIYANILNLRLTIKNAFVKSEIDHLLKTENVNDELWNKIQDLSLFDKRIIENKPGQYRKIQCNYIKYNPNLNVKDCENIEYSVITTSFIVPAFCENFKLSIDICLELRKKIPEHKIQKILGNINEMGLGKDDISYKYLENLLKKMDFIPISVAKVNNTNVISKTIYYMDKYFINTCIVCDSTKSEKYIEEMLNFSKTQKIKPLMKHLPPELIKEILDQYDSINDEEITMDILKTKCPSIPKNDFGEKTLLKYQEQYNNDSISVIAHYLTENEIRKLNIDSYNSQSVILNNNNYQIIQKESLLVNLIYISIYENINKSIAKEFQIVNEIFKVMNPTTPQQMLRKDIILYLSTINSSKMKQNMKDIIKQAVNDIWSANNLKVNNLSLHILYNEDSRKRMIQYLNDTKDFQSFQKQTKNYSKEDELENIRNNIQLISNNIKSTISTIESNFKYLLDHETRNNQLFKDGINKKNNKKYMEKIETLAKMILKPVDSNFEGSCIHIVDEGESFIQRFKSIRDISWFSKMIVKGKEYFKCDINIYSEESLQYMPTSICSNYDTFLKCDNAIKFYQDINKNFNDIKSTISGNFHVYKLINTIGSFKKQFKKYVNIDITTLCDEVIKSLKKIESMEKIINSFKVRQEPHLPTIDFYPIDEPFKNISYILMIGYKEGKVQLLNEINYDLGDCYANSILKLSISNLTKCSIKTSPPTQINQIGDNIILSMKIDKESQEIELLNNQDNSKIGIIKFTCNFVAPNIYLVFSTPITIDKDTIYIRDTIFDQLNISLFSNSSIMSHILKLDTQSGSEICESDVDIINTNSQILFTFHSPGKFRAKMLITFSVINLIISSEIDVFVKISNHTFIYDCKTNRECQLSERLPYPSYFLVKSPQVPICTDCKLYPEFKKPYLHLVYVNTRSNIKTITNTVSFSFKPSYYNIINDNYIVPKLSDFTPTVPNGYYSRYFEQSNDCVYLKEYYYSDVIVNFKFTNNNKLDSLVFRTVFNSPKNYSRDGILINNYDYMNNQIDLIITQINNSQKIFIDKNKNRVIPWINILRLFEKSQNDNIKSFAHKIPDNLILRKDQTYYVVANTSSIKPCYSIPELNINKSIKQNIRNTIEVDTKSYLSLIDLNCSDLYNILEKMKTIKSGMQLYKQIYNSNIEIASIISTVYRTLRFLKNKGIMENTIDEIISVGNKLFEDKYHSKNIEIILDSSKTESFENINFKYYKTKNDSHDVKIQETDESSDNEKTEHSYNSFVVSKSISDLKDKEILNNFVQIFSNDNNKSMNDDKKPAQQNIKTDKPIMNNETSNIIAASIDLKATKFDESQSPRNAYNRAYSPNPKLYDFSNIERDNKNLFLPNANLIEGKIPELDHYIFNIFALLIKSNFTLSLPKNHVTIMIDISVLSGKDNKNLVATNIMVSLQLLAAFDIQFSVWMFADRNLCFCVKKHTDIFDKKRQSIIRDAYFLDRRNPDSYLLSAIDTVSLQGFEKTSSLYIIFSTFVSSQVLTPFFKWDEKALNCLNNKHMIGFVEPCQYIEKDISNRLKDVLKESDFTHYITFTDIIISVKDLLLKIFQICKYNSRELQTSSEANLNISLHKFMNEPRIKHNSEFYVFKNMINVKKTKNSNHPKTKKLNVTKIEGKFETIDTSEMNFGDSNYSTIIMYPNKATRYELTSHGYIIDIQGLINSYFSNFSNMNIFKQKTGEKIREYSVSILIDASTIIRQYSIDHCFLSAISILSSIKELEIPYVNLSIAGKHIISLLVDQDLRYIPHTDAIYSKLYSTLIEEASETRSLVTGLQQIISHTLTDSIPNILFIITDALLGTDEENKIKDLLSFAQLNGTTIIGIGTGPTPFRIEEIFSWGVWSPNPYLLRESLNKLMQSSITKNIFKPYDSLPNPECPKEAPKMNEEITNSKILEPFANTEFINICIYESINSDAFDQSKLTGDFINKKSTEANVDGAYKGYKILVMMFYQGKPNTVDKYITEKVFREGPPNMPSNTKSPGDKFKEKGFDYKIVTKYKDSLNELLTGTYSIAMVCTASDGTEKGTEDENYLEPFLDAMAKFHQEGGAMILFGENPPYIFEINHILNRLPGIRVRLDEKKFDLGEGIMKASKTEEVKAGEFLAPKFKFAAKINGMICSDLPSLGGGLLNLSEGKTLAIFNNIDGSFKVFSRTTRNNPACIYRVPEGKEGVIFIDSGCSKLFHEYTETGAARYINNLSMGCIHYSNFRTTYHNNLNQEGIKFSINVRPRKPTIMKRQYKPLLLSIMIDATGSMSSIISSCKNKLNELINMCKSKVNQIDISIQFVAYRDICDGSKITEQHGITKSPDSIKNFISNIRAFGGCGWTADIDAGFEAALNQIESTSTNYTNVFILIGDAPNHDPSYSLSSHKSGNRRGERWQTVWNNINSRMSRKSIESLICISCGKEFELQYDIWGAYSCYHIRRIIEKYSITGQMPFESIFVNKISEVVQKIYMT